MSAVAPARRAAFGILKAIEQGRGHSDELLRGKSVAALSGTDRNLATALVLGVLRWQIELDRRIRPLLKHPNAKLDPEVLVALRLGAFQLLRMDRIPVHAAIDESVELTKQAGHRFASGMVNAVLRKLAGAPEESANDCCAAHPAWMVDRWKANYGDETASLICRHGQTQPNLTLRISEDAVDEELAAEGVVLRPGELLTSARQVAAGDVTKTAAFREGRVRIQDEGSQLIAELVPPGRAMLDCCAAPGGKTLIIAERNAERNPEARIVAFEASTQRLAQLRERLMPFGKRIQCRHADATAIEADSAFDVALADVPCSGTGTLGRNPEIRHCLLPEDLARQASRQKAILRAALSAIRPGGYVLYSTCSLEPEENEQVVAEVLSERADARLIPLTQRIEDLQVEGILIEAGAKQLIDALTPQGTLRLLPGALGTDGFYAALIQREA